MGTKLTARLLTIAVILIVILPLASREAIRNTFIHATGNMQDFNELYAEDFEKNMGVYGDLYFSYGCYVEEYSTTNGVRTSSKNTRQYYLVPVGLEEYIIVNVPSKMFADMDRLTEESYQLWLDEENAPLPSTVHLEGTVEKLDKEVKEYLYEQLIDEEFFDTTDTEVLDLYILPYMITYTDWKVANTITIVVMSISLIALLITIIVIISTVKKSKRNKELAADGYSDFANRTEPYGNINPAQPTDYANNYSYQPTDIENQYYNNVQKPDLTSAYIPQDNAYGGMDSLSSTTYDENQKPPCEL